VSWIDVNDLPPQNWKPNTKQFYTSATYQGWTHEGVKDLIKLHFKKDSSKDLTFAEFNKCLEWFETLPPNTVTTEHDKNTIEMF
jgi:hypothetical protein